MQAIAERSGAPVVAPSIVTERNMPINMTVNQAIVSRSRPRIWLSATDSVCPLTTSMDSNGTNRVPIILIAAKQNHRKAKDFLSQANGSNIGFPSRRRP